MRRLSIGRLGAVLVFVFAFLVAVPIANAKGGDNSAELKAREAFAAGRYEEALDLFAKLYAQTLHPVYLRNIGRCHQKLRQPDQAIDKFNEYLAKEKKISPDERKEIEGYIKDMETLRDEQARQKNPPPPPPNNVVTPVNPPPPQVNPYPPPPPPQYTTTSSATLVAQPAQSEEAPVYKKWWFWTGIGVVAAGTVVAVLVLSGGTTKPPCPGTAVKCLP
jgi:hypothetical protein